MDNSCLKHNECRNFIPVDVAKGICSASGELVLIDNPVCGKIMIAPKCKHCHHFALTDKEKGLGICKGLSRSEEEWSFAELPSGNCEKYCERKQQHDKHQQA